MRGVESVVEGQRHRREKEDEANACEGVRRWFDYSSHFEYIEHNHIAHAITIIN